MSQDNKTVFGENTRAACLVKPDERIHKVEGLEDRDQAFEIKGLAGEVKKIIEKAGLGLKIVDKSQLQPTIIFAEILFAKYRGTSYFQKLIDQVTKGEIVALLVEGENAPQKLWELAGPEDPAEARIQAPKSIRALLACVDESAERACTEDRAVDDVVYVANPYREGDVEGLGVSFFPEQFT